MKKVVTNYSRMLLLLTVLLLLSASFVYADTNGANVYRYVSLGDSLAAGYEPWMKDEWEEKQVMPHPYGFVERLHEQALFRGRTETNNYGIIGLTSSGLLQQLKAVQAERLLTPAELQERILDPRTEDMLAKYEAIKKDIANADIITITIGANDFLDLLTLINDMSSQKLQSLVNERLEQYKQNLTQSLEILYALNPDVRIVIADQYQPYPQLGNAVTFATLAGYNAQLTTALENVVSTYTTAHPNLSIAYVGERFVGRELSYVYINILEPEKSDIHPKQRGYEEIARVFAETIWGEYKTVITIDPIGIVINGKELETHYKPIVENGTTYVPVREYIEGALGGQVEWDAVNKIAVAKYNGQSVKYQPGSNIIEVNGQLVEMKDAVRLVNIDNEPNDKTYVPLRALAESGLKLDVQYVTKSKIAYINP